MSSRSVPFDGDPAVRPDDDEVGAEPDPDDGGWLSGDDGQGGGARQTLFRIGAVLAVLALAYAGMALVFSGRVPSGSTVGGVELGGMSRASATSTLERELAPRAMAPVQVLIGDAQAEIDPAQAGLRLDVEETVDSLLDFNLDPRIMWAHVFGSATLPAATDVDESALRTEVERVAAEVDGDPVEGTVTFVEGVATAGPAEQGRRTDVPDAVQLIEEEWLANEEPLALPAELTAPEVDSEAVDEAMETFAVPAASGPLTLAYDQTTAVLEPQAFTPALAMVPDTDGSLVPQADGEALLAALLVVDPEVEVAARDAQFSLESGSPTILPSVTGMSVDPEALAEAVLNGVVSPDRVATVELVVAEPTLTTEQAQELGVQEVVSEFSTNLTDNPGRTENIQIAARTMNGTLVLPGEMFSLNEVLGERTPEKGYNEAPVIINGRLEQGFGGGVSQVATTTFNAVFFAGLEDVEHRPHSFYISRYPEGREATINFGTIDLRWRNDSPHGVLVQAGTGGDQITVRFWSTKVWDIEAEKGPRTEIQEPETIYDDSEECIDQSAAEGFRVEVDRLFYAAGNLERTETFTTRYLPQNRVVCGPEPGATPTPGATPGATPAPTTSSSP